MSEDLGGARVHAEISGVAHLTAPDDGACLVLVRDLLSYLPSNNMDGPPDREPEDDPEDLEDAIHDQILAHRAGDGSRGVSQVVLDVSSLDDELVPRWLKAAGPEVPDATLATWTL